MLTPHPLHFVQHLLPQEKACFRYTLDSLARVILSVVPTRYRAISSRAFGLAPKVRQAQDDTRRDPTRFHRALLDLRQKFGRLRMTPDGVRRDGVELRSSTERSEGGISDNGSPENKEKGRQIPPLQNIFSCIPLEKIAKPRGLDCVDL